MKKPFGSRTVQTYLESQNKDNFKNVPNFAAAVKNISFQKSEQFKKSALSIRGKLSPYMRTSIRLTFYEVNN